MIDVKTVVQGQRTPRYAPLINDRAKTVLLYRCKYGYHQLQTLVVALMMTKLDYGSATLAGLPAVQLDRLQSVLNAAARLIYRRRKFDHVTPLLKELHWLRVPERITFRLAVLAC